VSLVVFEDALIENFYPLTFTRAGFELFLGTRTLLENLTQTHDNVSVFARNYLKSVLKRRLKHRINIIERDGETSVVNALINPSKAKKLLGRKGRFVALSGNNVVAARVPARYVSTGDHLAKLATLKKFDRLKADESSLYKHPWELVDDNARAIAEQANGFPHARVDFFVNGPKNRAIVSPKAEIESPATIETRRGPVVIDSGAHIDAMTRLEGPCYVGKNSKIRSAQIGEGVSIGNSCVIGGEVEHSIIQSYSNKAHLGYLGHSIVGSWVNLGAQTTNSNLKNTYGEIKVNGVNTQRIKVGCYIGDDTKTAIGTLIFAGRKIGIASQVYGFTAEDVPSFTIYAKTLDKSPVELELQSAIETQKRMMARRGVKQSSDDVNLLRQVFEMTIKERRNMSVGRQKFKL
jgi:UDP-N-acetylglucosamine diphosphorylase/glucosamine-1-phosphate N-acetyltransferase